MIDLTGIRNIIFDLGEVLLYVNERKTHEAFIRLGLTTTNDLYRELSGLALFSKFEKGEISPKEFRDQLKLHTGLSASDKEIDHAWTAMLGDFPAERLRLLERLSASYNLFLLSNTNQIHLAQYRKNILTQHGRSDLLGVFIKEYFSCEVGMRKPEVRIFEFVIADNQLTPEETLFVDDREEHIKGAKKAGLQMLHIEQGKDVLYYFRD